MTSPDRQVSADECAAMASELPGLVPAIIDADAWLPLMDRAADALTPADIDLPHIATEQVLPRLRDLEPNQPLRGDLHPDNLLPTPSRPPLWIGRRLGGRTPWLPGSLTRQCNAAAMTGATLSCERPGG
jgi:hypothetical protein